MRLDESFDESVGKPIDKSVDKLVEVKDMSIATTVNPFGSSTLIKCTTTQSL